MAVRPRGTYLGPDQYLMCRTIGHEWDLFTPIGMERPTWGIRLSLRCDRCSMERHDIVDTLGEVASRTYVQPENYSMSHIPIDDRPGRVDYRVELARRYGERGPRLSRPEPPPDQGDAGSS